MHTDDGATSGHADADVQVTDVRPPTDDPDATWRYATSVAPGSPSTATSPPVTSPPTSGQSTADGSESNGFRRRVDQRNHWQHRVWRALTRDVGIGMLFGILLAAVFGGLGAVASLGGTTSYTSSTVMIIDDPYQLATSGDQNWFVKLDALRVKYSGLTSTEVMAGPVAKELHLSVGSVMGAVSTQAPYTSLLMYVDATWSNAHEAQLVSQAMANEVTTYVHQEDQINDIPAVDQFTFTTVDPASAAAPHSPSKSHAVVLAIGLAVLGFLLGFVATQLVRFLN